MYTTLNNAQINKKLAMTRDLNTNKKIKMKLFDILCTISQE